MTVSTDLPARAAHDFAPLERLWERDAGAANGAPDTRGDPRRTRGDGMPADVVELYGGELRLPLRTDRPAIVVNFVSSLDGVVALDPREKSGGGAISGFYEPDRFVMALLRALADVVVVGAGTVRASPRGEWTARQIDPKSAESTARWRRAMGLSPQPTTVVVTAGGNLDLRHPGLSARDVPVVIVTTEGGARRLEAEAARANARIVAIPAARAVPAEAVVDVTRALGASVVLCEGGPHLLGGFVAAHLVDELFLTLAPQVLGRSEAEPRLALIEGVTLTGDPARWLALHSVRRSGDHMFLRYRAKEAR